MFLWVNLGFNGYIMVIYWLVFIVIRVKVFVNIIIICEYRMKGYIKFLKG